MHPQQTFTIDVATAHTFITSSSLSLSHRKGYRRQHQQRGSVCTTSADVSPASVPDVRHWKLVILETCCKNAWFPHCLTVEGRAMRVQGYVRFCLELSLKPAYCTKKLTEAKTL